VRDDGGSVTVRGDADDVRKQATIGAEMLRASKGVAVVREDSCRSSEGDGTRNLRVMAGTDHQLGRPYRPRRRFGAARPAWAPRTVRDLVADRVR